MIKYVSSCEHTPCTHTRAPKRHTHTEILIHPLLDLLEISGLGLLHK